jgi:hypothetical protein
MWMLNKITLVILCLVATTLAYAATRPDAVHVERTASIKAPPDRIFPFIDDLRSWTSWSPWEKLDPAMERTYGGAASGRGAVYSWKGNRRVGQGRMEIIDASQPARVTIRVHFSEPFETHNVARFTLSPQGDSTSVTWSMDGSIPYIVKVMGIFVNLDTMIGKDFEAGLANLKTLAENRAVNSEVLTPNFQTEVVR